MNDPTPLPTRSLKFVSALARWALSLLLAFWLILAAAWGALHGWIVPRIAELRPTLETQASRVLGQTVRIGHVQARSDGLIPSFELDDVSLLDPDGHVALLLPRVVAALSPRSLWNLGFEQLYIERPELEVRRTAQGQILVAGMDFSSAQHDDGRVADWVFSQTELVISEGLIHWTDEQRGGPVLSLSDVGLVLRNSPRRHLLRLDATPPPAWGEPFTLMGQFRQPLLSAHRGRWQDWTGQLYALFQRVDVARLREQVDLGLDVASGQGALRLWADVHKGQLTGAVADVAMAEVRARLAPGLDPLALDSVQGRLGGHRLADGFDFSTTGLQFLTADGLRWPGGNLFFHYTEAQGRQPERSELRADRLDLAALSQIAHALPLGDELHQALQRLAPAGLVDTLRANWSGALSAPTQYSVKGRVSDLGLASQESLPGVHGLSADFELDRLGGQATLQMDQGTLDLPAVFDDPRLQINHLDAQLSWKIDGERIDLDLPSLHLATPDGRGDVRLHWHTSDPARSAGRSRFPGVLDLNGNASDVDATRVWRYLPRVLPADVRNYVREAISAGRVGSAQFKVRGDLHDLPFANPRQGDFHIVAHAQDVAFDYAPKALLPSATLPWPALKQLSGDLVFDRQGMQVHAATARFAAQPELVGSQIEAEIPDLRHSVVGVDAVVRGPLPDALALVVGSPLNRMTGQVFAQSTSGGPMDLRLKLSLPLAQLERSRVQGSVNLAGNDLRLSPQASPMTRVRGSVSFSDTGFSLNNVQAHALGGDLRVEGGMKPGATPAQEPQILVRATGVASAEGLRQASELGLLAGLAAHASGSAPYSLTLGFYHGQPEIQVSSNLLGMALDLPAPLGKAADVALPLRFDNSLLHEAGGAQGPLRDQLQVELGRQASIRYVRDLSQPQARVLRGSIGIGLGADEAAPMPEDGVRASVNLARVDVDAWEQVLARAGGPVRPSAGAAGQADTPAQGYLPTTLAVRAQELQVDGRTLHHVVVGGSRDGAVWRANLDADELSGYVEYRQPGAAGGAQGRVFARLARLKLAQNTQNEVESLLDEQPASIPSLDIVVDDFELRGKRLGRVEMEAINRGGDGNAREWRLSRFNIATPEATLTATGNWASLQAQAAEPRSARGPHEARRTVMNFRLDIRDAGELLGRFGMPGVVRQGHGHLEGQVAWQGSPLTLDTPSLSGQINIDVESGQFLKADPGLAKLLGVLSLQALPRRLTLDFRDVFSEGFAFDLVRGDARIEQGIATTNNLQMKGVNAAVLMDGHADIARETQDLKVVVVPEINAGTASLVATAINPAIGLGSFLAQIFLRRPLIEAATQEFHIDGTWADPHVVKVDNRKHPAPAPHTGDSP